MAYCTLFDSNYLDKGIVMINSLKKVDLSSKIYVLCMDEKCKTILDDFYNYSIKTISLNEFEDQQLLQIKTSRSRAEYCWTCTAKLIKYVIQVFNENIVTYVDADLKFYSNPTVLIEEMVKADCTVQVVSHRFPNTKSGLMSALASGKNCVQFNTFVNETKSIQLLDEWIDQCVKECSLENAGDQKYTDDWDKYEFVNISKNIGAGIAPWNLSRYKFINTDTYTVYDRYDKMSDKIVFYHYQNIINLDRYTVRLQAMVGNAKLDKKFFYSLYLPYLYELESVKKIVEEKYGYLPLVTSYVSDCKESMFMKMKKYKRHSLSEYISKGFNMIRTKVRTTLRRKIYIVRLDDRRK